MTQDLIVLDGGMGKHLQNSGAPFRQPEWSALALLEEPSAVLQAHLDFIDAGADVIIANTYAVVPFHLGEGRFAERGEELAALAGGLARDAASRGDRNVRVAGSLPPLFGSYEPQSFRAGDAPDIYDTLIKAQADSVDLWIGETVSSIAEAEAIIAALDRHAPDSELWISFTVPDEPSESVDTVRLRSGETIAKALESVEDRVSAILFNCSPPEAIDLALKQLHDALGGNPQEIRTGAYANAFEAKPEGYRANEVSVGRREDLDDDEYRDICGNWVHGGASIVGGCCHIAPSHIAELQSLRGQAPRG